MRGTIAPRDRKCKPCAMQGLECVLLDLEVRPPHHVEDVMSKQSGILMSTLFAGSLLLPAPLTAGGQVPIHGVTGTLALPANVDKFYTDMNTILEKAGDGIDHIGHKTKGAKGRERSASLDGLQPGTPVVGQYAVKGIQTSAAATANESIVTRVDRSRERITIAFKGGESETLRLATHGPYSDE